jgi:tRNA-dihydrouridine synthase B
MSQETQIYLAPFQGITGTIYRETYARHFSGVDKMLTPFFTGIIKEGNLSGRKAFELEKTNLKNIEIVPQILSKDADEIISFGKLCGQKGFSEINWNLGCPYARVANKKRGSGMLPFPEMATEILEKVMPEMPIKFSIKCRLGYVSAEEIFQLIPVFNHFQIAELTIHARIGKQLYKGPTDLETFEKALPLIEVPVVYNGDIFSKTSYINFQKRFPSINLLMIGRGLLVDPFLPSIIKGNSPESGQKQIAHRFITDLYLAYRKHMNGRLQAISVMKELWGFMAFSFSEPHQAFNRLKKSKSFDEYEEAVAEIFEKHEWLGSGGGLCGVEE